MTAQNTITLTEAEVAVVRILASLRTGNNRCLGTHDAKKADDGFEIDLLGVAGEFAFAKKYNLFPDLTFNPRSLGHDFNKAEAKRERKVVREATRIKKAEAKTKDFSDPAELDLPDPAELDLPDPAETLRKVDAILEETNPDWPKKPNKAKEKAVKEARAESLGWHWIPAAIVCMAGGGYLWYDTGAFWTWLFVALITFGLLIGQ